MTRNEYTVDELADVLLRAGFVECNIAACNCGSWHHRYGLPERFSEIKDALMDAGVLNNETGNLPIRAIAKLVEQRDALRSRLAAQENAARQADERGDEAMRRAHAAEARLAEAERDRDAGWKAFYALREQVGKDRYPGLTNIVRTTDSATVIVQDKLASTLNPHPMLSPTHRCTSCGALWRQCDDFSMNLRSPTCCDACNNAPCAAGVIPLVVEAWHAAGYAGQLEARLAAAEALLREESHEQYRFTQMTEYPSVMRMLLWHMDRRRRIDAHLAREEKS